jgi:hypothetical protein
MEKRSVKRWVWLLVAILAGVVLVRIGLLLMSPLSHAVAGKGTLATRSMAVAYLLCDLAISFSMITLLVLGDRRSPSWVERRLPYRGRWLWHLLLGLTILSYLSLAPTFLFFLIRMNTRR